jgi:tripartite-type tricarboxylate transporter receptor subunit TctC
MRKSIPLICVLAGLVASAMAQAETWPARLIKATIPFGAGSATDVVPRLVFDRLAVELGQPIVIENRAGAGGTLGTAVVEGRSRRLQHPGPFFRADHCACDFPEPDV